MKYSSLFECRFTHEYYAPDFLCPDISCIPTADTRLAIQNHRLIAKYYHHGFSLAFPQQEDVQQPQPFIPIKADTTFSFLMYIEHSAFLHLTDFPAMGIGALMPADLVQFSSPATVSPANKEVQLEVQKLNPDTYEPGLIAHYRQQAPTKHLWGILKLRNLNPVEMKVYTYQFKVRSTNWTYYLSTNIDPGKKGAFTIQDAEGNLTFDTEIIDTNNPLSYAGYSETDIRTIENIRAQFPDNFLVRFSSQQLISYSSLVRSGIQLLQNGKLVRESLPNPPPENIGIQLITYIRNPILLTQ